MRNILLITFICALSATLNAGKCDDAKTFLESNRSALEALKKGKQTEHQGRGRIRRGGDRVLGAFIVSRTMTLLEREIAKTSGQNEKRCEKYQKILDALLRKQGDNSRSDNGTSTGSATGIRSDTGTGSDSGSSTSSISDCSTHNNDKVKCSSAKVNDKPCVYKEETQSCVAGP